MAKTIELRPIEAQDWPKDLASAMAPIIAPNGNTIDLFKIHAHNPGIFVHMVDHIESGFTLTEREAIILRTLYNCENSYEIFYHKKMYARSGGTEKELDRILRDFGGDSENEKIDVIIQAVDDIFKFRKIGKSTIDAMSTFFTEMHVFEILMYVHRYMYFSAVINTANIELESNAEEISRDLIGQAFGD
jgi:hypothetical protein